MTTFSLRQVTSIVDGNKYQVSNEVTAATDADTATYVYKTANQEFSNYASAADMQQWPIGYEQAQVLNVLFYRLPALIRTWDTVPEMNDDLDTSVRRLQSLADEMNALRGDIVIDRTTVITGV